jgi:hypothetical protein
MWKCGLFGLVLLTSMSALAQDRVQSQKKTPRKDAVRPECAQGAICFDGEVEEGKVYRKALTAELDFLLHVPGGIDVVSRHPDGVCNLSQWIANPPLMAHHSTEIDAGYEWTADDEVELSIREFKIVESCRQFQSLFDLVYDPARSDPGKYFEALRVLPGSGRLWITGSRVSHTHDYGVAGHGAIEWLKVAVEIKLSNTH